uniref:Secretory protein n=1 Tax=Chilobrachys guangxiensis TaxID=278060 RepID=B1P1K0_CHIGU|nr:secretory protein [Chilobrachys guangxiensis]
MRPQILAVVGSLAALLLLLAAPSSARKIHDKEKVPHHKLASHTHTERSHHGSERNDLDDHHTELYNYITSHEEQVACHRAALHKCGQIFLKAFKLLHYVNKDVSFQTKCALRTAFFSCLKKIQEKTCRSQNKHVPRYEDNFRQKLTDALWSTRVCVLGVKT